MNLNHLTKEEQNKLMAVAYKKLERISVNECFDPIDLSSRASKPQQEVLDGINKYKHRYIRSGNQCGKSQMGAREVSWVFEDNHPNWSRPKKWGDEPILLIVVGRTSKQVEEVLWRKLKGFLNPATFKEQRSGGALQKITNTENGNTIIFASHHSENEAREKLQAFVAHYVWIDEMPGSVELVEELHRRVQARDGYFLATFTPKVRNDKMRKFVDAQEDRDGSAVFQMSMFDNPIYQGREEELLSQMAGLPEAYVQSVLYGHWLQDDCSVYQFNSDIHVVDNLPEGYSPSWRHVEAVDPALQSKMGFILFAEDPNTGIWYICRADYIKGIYVPEELVDEVTKKTTGFNIARRTSDVAPWYVNTANNRKMKPSYTTVHDKVRRKGDLIKNLQTALGNKVYVCSWCTDLIDEFADCRWSETAADKIVNAQSYHLLDAVQYGIDVLPKAEREQITLSPDHLLQHQNNVRLNNKAKQEQIQKELRSRGGQRKSYRIGKTNKRWGR